MTEKQRKYEAEVRLVKPQILMPESKHEDVSVYQVNANLKRVHRTFSRETVVRLINWFKQE
ncbi:MAG TPA: hypothetical protein VIS10_02555 [Anaerolineales bacterium]